MAIWCKKEKKTLTKKCLNRIFACYSNLTDEMLISCSKDKTKKKCAITANGIFYIIDAFTTDSARNTYI